MRLRSLIFILALLACASLRERALPRAWAANQTAIIVNSGYSVAGQPSTSVASYNAFPWTGNQPWRTTNTDAGEEVAGSYTFTNLHIDLLTAPGGTGSWTFTVDKNRAPTAMTLTVTGAATSGDFTGSFSAVATDILDISVTPANTPTQPGRVSWYTQTVGPAQYIPVGIQGSVTFGTGTTRSVAAVGGGASPDTVTENRPWPTAGTFRNLYMTASVDPGGSGQSITVTLTTGADPGDADPSMSNSALTLAINTGSTTASDTSHTVHVTAGQFVQFTFVSSASAATTRLYGGYEFVPDTPGECVQMAESIGSAQGTDQFGFATIAQKAAETDALTPMPVVVVSKMRGYFHAGTSTYASITSGQTVTLTLRKNQAPTSLVLSQALAARKVTDLTHTVTFAANDKASVEFVASASTGTWSVHYGWVYAVTQPASGVAGSLSLMGVGK